MGVLLGRIAVLVVVVLAAGACGTGGDQSAPAPTTAAASFCQMSQQAIADADAALKTLTSGGGSPASMQQTHQQLAQGTNLMIQALHSPPTAIATDAPVVITQLQQIVAASNNNTVAPPLTPAEQAANQSVNAYLQNTCGIRSTNLFSGT